MRVGFTVPPLKKRYILNETAATVRERFRPLMGNGAWVPIEMIYEAMPLLLPGFRSKSATVTSWVTTTARPSPKSC